MCLQYTPVQCEGEIEVTEPLNKQFNTPAAPDLETLRLIAAEKSLFYFAMRNPGQKIYKNFCESVEAYAAAFAAKYASPFDYIAEQNKVLSELAAQKGISVVENGPITLEDDVRQQISQMVEALQNSEAKYLNLQLFAEYFVLKLPLMAEKIAEKLNTLPDQSLTVQRKLDL